MFKQLVARGVQKIVKVQAASAQSPRELYFRLKIKSLNATLVDMMSLNPVGMKPKAATGEINPTAEKMLLEEMTWVIPTLLVLVTTPLPL